MLSISEPTSPYSDKFGVARRVLGVKYFADGRRYEVERIQHGKRHCFWESEVIGIRHLIQAFERRQRKSRVFEKELRTVYQTSDVTLEDDDVSVEETIDIDDVDYNGNDDEVISQPRIPTNGDRKSTCSQDGLSPKVWSSKRSRIPCKRYLDFEEVTPTKKQRLKKTSSPSVIRPTLTSNPIVKKPRITTSTPVKSSIVRTVVSSSKKGRPSTKVVHDDFLYQFEDQEDFKDDFEEETKAKKTYKELNMTKFYLEKNSQFSQCLTPKSIFKSSMSTCSTARRSSSSSEEEGLGRLREKDKLVLKLERFKARGIKPKSITEGVMGCIVEFIVDDEPVSLLVSVEILSSIFKEEYNQHYEEKKLSQRKPSLFEGLFMRRSSVLDSSFDDTCSRYSLCSSKIKRFEMTLDIEPETEEDYYHDLNIDPEVKQLMEAILMQVQESIIITSPRKRLVSRRVLSSRLETNGEVGEEHHFQADL